MSHYDVVLILLLFFSVVRFPMAEYLPIAEDGSFPHPYVNWRRSTLEANVESLVMGFEHFPAEFQVVFSLWKVIS